MQEKNALGAKYFSFRQPRFRTVGAPAPRIPRVCCAILALRRLSAGRVLHSPFVFFALITDQGVIANEVLCPPFRSFYSFGSRAARFRSATCPSRPYH